MSRTNETRFIELHETCKCECKFGANYECECDKACDVGEYSDYENCKRRKKLVAPLIKECTETVEEVKLAKITLAKNENSCKCKSCTVYIVLMIVFFIICTKTSAYFVYYNWSLVKNASHIKFGTHTQTTIYWTYKWEKSNKLTLKIDPMIFTTIRLI